MDPMLFVRADAVETFGVARTAVEDAGADVRVWDAIEAGSERPGLDDVSGVVLFGSSSNVEQAEEKPFIQEIHKLTLDALDRDVPFLGVCFGAQVLAWALGRDVVQAPAREFGYHSIRLEPEAPSDPLVSHYDDGDMVFEWHRDTFELPEEATLLASGDGVRNQAYRVGDRAWGIQYHLEVDDAELESWLRAYTAHGDLEGDWGRPADAIRADAARHQPAHERKGAEAFAKFAGVVRDLAE